MTPHLACRARLVCVSAALSGLAALAGCAGGPSRYEGPVRVISGDAVAGCAFLEQVETSSGLVGLLAPQGVENNKQQLLRRAEQLGGTHVVWSKPVQGDRATELSARVYRCPETR